MRPCSPAPSVFACTPSKGVVAPHSFALVTFRFDAADTRVHHERLVCALNGSSNNSIALETFGAGHVPHVRVGVDNSFVFKPTCVGAVTARDVELVNLSRINVLYEWAIPERLAATWGVSPHAVGGGWRILEGLPRHPMHFEPSSLG